MEPTIRCGKHFAEHADLSGSRFVDVNLAGAEFDNVNLSGAKINNVNLSDIVVTCVQVGGASFRWVGLPPGAEGQQRGVHFEETTLCGSTFRKADLTNVAIQECNLEGMRIDGLLVTDLIESYRKSHQDTEAFL